MNGMNLAPNHKTTVRQPRSLIIIDGATIAGALIEVEVENNGYHAADTFHVTLAVGALPQGENAPAYLAAQETVNIEVFIGTPANPHKFGPADLTSWIYGQADEIRYDPARNVIEIQGRDLTQLLIDNKVTFKWTEMTSSQIAYYLAMKNGLETRARNAAGRSLPTIHSTTGKAGNFLKHATDMAWQGSSQWDLLCALADVEDFQVFVRGRTLYFMPKAAYGEPYDLIWRPATGVTPQSANFQRISLHRNLKVSRGIQVKISTYHDGLGQGFTASYPDKPKPGAQVYEKYLPRLMPDQALKRAKAMYNQLTQHEMSIEVELPGDDAIDINSVIRLTGTATAFDQTYYPTSIRRSVSVDGGYSMTIHAQNQAPGSMVTE